MSRPNTSGIALWVDTNYNVFLVNTTESAQPLPPGELIGFNTGSFNDVLTSAAKAAKDTMMWSIKADNDLVVFDKKAIALADLICNLANDRGVLDIQLQDYNLKALTEARFLKQKDFSRLAQRFSNLFSQCFSDSAGRWICQDFSL